MTAYLTTAEVAAHYRKSSRTIEYWRQIGYGPSFVRIRGTVRYPAAAIEAFDAEVFEASIGEPRSA